MTRSVRRSLALGLATAVVAGGGTLLLSSGGQGLDLGLTGPQPAPAPPAQFALAALKGDVVPWARPLTVTATEGTLTAVTATGPDGALFSGTLTPSSWTSRSSLVPGGTYALHVELRNRAGRRSTYDRTVRASQATQQLQARIAPAGGVYGVGQPVVVRFNHAVKGAAARSAVLTRLSVTTSPDVPGAWRWFNSYEVHYRGASYWPTGTVVSVRANLGGLQVPDTRIWGSTTASTGGMTIGDALIATVDVKAHTMTVRRNGAVVRVVDVSTGRDKYPTKGGVHLVLVREKVHLYNSATVGIPTSSPDGYYEKLPWSVRISNGGAFVHANPATVRFQGRVNVSHGCVNASVADAKWFYENTHLGDVVDVVNAAVPPLRTDAGMADWNYTWDEWQQGNLGT
jgi:lipoprotein-anchoring transpeptidase ErfK/SrfK